MSTLFYLQTKKNHGSSGYLLYRQKNPKTFLKPRKETEKGGRAVRLGVIA
jgi:hypothetical protein